MGAQESDDPPMRFGLDDGSAPPPPPPANTTRVRGWRKKPGTETEGLAFTDAPKIFLRDLTRALTAPARWNGPDWLLAGEGVALTGAAALLDDPVRNFAARHHTRGMNRYTRLTEPFGAEYSIGVLGLFALGSLKVDDPRVGAVAYDGAVASVVGGGILCQVIKVPVGRARPFQADSPWHFRPLSGHVSFPSGHTTQAFTVLSVVAAHFANPVVDVLCYGLAASVGWARIYHDRHWTSDVVGGACLGTAVGRGVVAINNRSRTGDGHAGLRLEPRLAGGVAGVAVTAPL